MNLTFDSRQPWWLQTRTLNLAGFLWCAGLMAYALFVQYGLRQEPCPLCILQRVAVIAAGVLFLLAWLHNPAGAAVRRVYGVLDRARRAGRHRRRGPPHLDHQAPAGAVAECGASLEYMMDVLPLHEVLGKVLSGSGECAKVNWRFLGFSMPFWVLINLLGVAALGLFANWRKQ